MTLPAAPMPTPLATQVQRAAAHPAEPTLAADLAAQNMALIEAGPARR